MYFGDPKVVVPGQVSINMFLFECPVISFSLDLLLIFWKMIVWMSIDVIIS